jgi:hypothetical protein
MLTEAWEGDRLPKGSDRGNREAGAIKRERTERRGEAATVRVRRGDTATEGGKQTRHWLQLSYRL